MNTHKQIFQKEIQTEAYREVLYTLMVRREAIKASHARLFKKLKSSVWH